MLKIKNISRDNWPRVLKKELTYKSIEVDGAKAEISLIKFLKITEPLVKRYKNISIKLVEEGFYWLQIGVENKNYWITVMFNDKEEIIQFYFDITKKNYILGNGKSYFYDLYLDVVVMPDGYYYLLDEDELKEALDKNEISKADFNMAYYQAERIEMFIDDHIKRLTDFSYSCFKTLLNARPI